MRATKKIKFHKIVAQLLLRLLPQHDNKHKPRHSIDQTNLKSVTGESSAYMGAPANHLLLRSSTHLEASSSCLNMMYMFPGMYEISNHRAKCDISTLIDEINRLVCAFFYLDEK